jgi:hypothetical protein
VPAPPRARRQPPARNSSRDGNTVESDSKFRVVVPEDYGTYADDFVVLCATRARAEEARRRVEDILVPFGLRLPLTGVVDM